MKEQLLLKISVTTGECVNVSGGGRNISLVPFGGEADSDLFTGAVLGEGVDRQMTEGGVTQLSARYMLEGRDLSGGRCRIFIENNGSSDQLSTAPQITTDGRLIGWLNNASLRGSIKPDEGGVCVSIFEQLYGFERIEHCFTAADGRRIYGELFLPDNGESRHPLLIAAHGFNSGTWQLREQIEQIVSRGVACYAFDFCGGGNGTKSDGSPAEMSIRTEQRDLRDVFEHITALPEVDPERVYLYGESQGGFVTALTAAELGERVKGLFLVYPAFCIPHEWLGRIEEFNETELIEFMGVKLSRKYAEEVPDYDIYAQAAKFKGHVTIFHGDCDRIVDLSYSEKLAEVCPDAELFVCPEQGHQLNSRFKRAAAGMISDRIRFLDKI